MFSVILIADGRTEALAATAAACVPAVADGLVGHGVIVAQPEDKGAARVADAMGADVASSIAHAVRIARGEWALLLAAGDLPEEGWMGEVERLALTGGRAGYLPRVGIDRAVRKTLALIGLSPPLGPGSVASLPALRLGQLGRPVILPVHRRRVATR